MFFAFNYFWVYIWGIKGFDKTHINRWVHFFLSLWRLVRQFIEISNQMEPTGEVSKYLYNVLLYKKNLSMFDTSPVGKFDWKFL